MTARFDDTIERVEVILCNTYQREAYLLQQQTLQAQEDDPPLKFLADPRFLSWIGASVLPKLESAKEMFINRDKFQSNFVNYREQFAEQKSK